MRTALSIRRLVTVLGCLSLIAPLAACAADRRSSATGTGSGAYAPPPTAGDVPPQPGQIAPRLQNLGSHAFAVTTSIARAQAFINQGLILSYGFNHREAARAFAEAARLDPQCAMAYWGHALVLGPNINMPMAAENGPKAHAILQKAIALKSRVSQKERDFIDALAKRYSPDINADRRALDRAYADAMARVAQCYPDDTDAQTLYAEALMDLQPWDYWTTDGLPKESAEEIIATLEGVMEREADHPGANHLYIHMVEASTNPRRGLASADRLNWIAPGAGHLVHMPSHIYLRLGMYEQATQANRRAILADEDYIVQCRAQGIYPLAYYPHNIHFLWSAASMEGRGAEAIDAAWKVAEKAMGEDTPQTADPVAAQTFVVTPLLALARFGKWEDILAYPAPPRDHLFHRGVWRYARALALNGLDRLSEAEQELAALNAILADRRLDAQTLIFVGAAPSTLLTIAREVVAGEVAASRGDIDQAVAHLDRAVRLEDSTPYNEPPEWHMSTRLNLGAVLLAAGRADEAEVVYWDDLRKRPHNGWALFGLAQALRAQGEADEAAVIEQRFRDAWRNADVRLTASRF